MINKKTITLIIILVVLIIATLTFVFTGGFKNNKTGNATSTATTTAPLTLEQRVLALEQKTYLQNDKGEEIAISSVVIDMARTLQQIIKANATTTAK